MKKLYAHIKKLAFSFLFFLIIFANSLQAQTPFSGTRTVDSGGYYASLTAAIADAAFNGIIGKWLVCHHH